MLIYTASLFQSHVFRRGSLHPTPYTLWIMIVEHKLVDVDIKQTARSPFSRWNELSWIRSKPIRKDSISGLPFSPKLVPLSFHQTIAEDSNAWMTVLAYRLLTHLQFTTLLELNYVNPVCSALVQGQAPIFLTTEQRNDALRIYCDEGGHALFVELLSTQVEETFGINRSIISCIQFHRTLENIIAKHQTRLSPNLIKLFFVTISETLVTNILNNIPDDPQVASVIRAVISDHAADEALHSIYFRNLFPLLWHSLAPYEKKEMGQLLPQLVWAFLEPELQIEYNVLIGLGFDAKDAEDILEEVYVPGQVAQAVRQTASPTLKMFEAAGVFSIPAVKQCFVDHELILQ